MIHLKNGILGKVCSTCHEWKSLDEFPTDPTHASSQGRHCRCRDCHKKFARRRRQKLALVRNAVIVIAMGVCAVILLQAKGKPRTYETGKLVDVSVQEVTRGIAVISGMAAPIPGKLYTFQIQVNDLTYFAEYRAGKLSYKPDWVVNDPIQARLGDDNKMYLKRSNGQELEVLIVKKVRQKDSNN